MSSFNAKRLKRKLPRHAGKGIEICLINQYIIIVINALRKYYVLNRPKKRENCGLTYLPVKILRQQTIGNYIVDFYCASAKLVIELDGIQHYSEEGQKKDNERDGYLNGLGITVVRYTNLDIQRQFDSVCADIKRRLNIE